MSEPKQNFIANESNNDSNKIQNNYELTLKKLVAIVRGKENLNPKSKIKRDVLETIVDGLLKEKKESTEKEVKEGLNNLLLKKIEFDKLAKEKQEELNKIIQSKQKEFIDSANKLFSLIDGLNTLEEDYYKSLGEATNK